MTSTCRIRSLDILSEYVEGIGVERAQQELYDQLVTYVGEVLRLRIQGRWEVNSNDRSPYPYLIGAKHELVMPINVVWEQLSGLDPVNLRAAAGNEVRRARTEALSRHGELIAGVDGTVRRQGQPSHPAPGSFIGVRSSLASGHGIDR